jgi:SAM-dependent methyltransferase
MHAQAYNWVARYYTEAPVAVLDLGGRDINGSVRKLFPGARLYIVLDIAPGENVDVVADASTWAPDREYDVVVSCETFEHTPEWPAICATAFKALRPGGMFLATMAGPGRPEHSGIDGGWTLHPGEHYRNVRPGALRATLLACGFARVVVDQQYDPADVRAMAVK